MSVNYCFVRTLLCIKLQFLYPLSVRPVYTVYYYVHIGHIITITIQSNFIISDFPATMVILFLNLDSLLRVTYLGAHYRVDFQP